MTLIIQLGKGQVMPPIGYVVFKADGTAGIHCGNDHEGNEVVAWIGSPEVVAHDVDEKGDGEAGYQTSFPAPADDDGKRK